MAEPGLAAAFEQPTGDTGDESAALDAIARQDPAGLEALARLHQHRAIQIAYLMLGDRQTAEDVVADALIKVYHKITQFDRARPFWPWFCRIVLNNALAWLRKHKRIALWDEHESLEDGAVTPSQQAESTDLRRRVIALIGRLPPEQRAAVILRYYYAYDDVEIAHVLNVPHATVRWRMHWAKKKLRGWADADPHLRGAWED
jgi:RNA polymerase sigma-70 factor, ECF subfamily